MQSRRAFTVTELLVVIGIIAVLMAILIPVVSRARIAGNRVACRANLSDIGRQFQMYLNDSRNRLPWVNPIPSMTPPIPGKPVTEVFAPYVKGATGGWRCPSDAITKTFSGTPPGFQTYFEREGISYFYNPQLALLYAGKQLNDHPLYRNKKQNQLMIFYEFEPFHGAAGTNGSMNYLFADMHVGDLANE